MDNILIIKTSAFGDIVHTFPTVEYLRLKFPKAKIDWVVENPCAELAAAHPEINRVIPIATKRWRKELARIRTYREIATFRRHLRQVEYDVAFDLQGNIKSGLILSQVRARTKVGFGSASVPEKPNLLFTDIKIDPQPGANVRSDYLAVAAGYFGEPVPNVSGKVVLKIREEHRAALKRTLAKAPLKGRPHVAVCPGSAWQNKQLPPAALAAFLSRLQTYMDCNLHFIWGTQGEKLIAEDLAETFQQASHVVERMSLPELQNYMGLCDLVVAMDSLPLHLAGTTSTRTFSVFGASSALKYKPLGAVHTAYQGTCPYGKVFEKRCSILRTCKTGACIRDLEGSQVFDEFLRWDQSKINI